MKTLLLLSALISTSAFASTVYRDDISLATFRPQVEPNEPVYFKSPLVKEDTALYCMGPEDWTLVYWGGPCAPDKEPRYFVPVSDTSPPEPMPTAPVPIPGAFWLLLSGLGLLWRRS